MSKKMLFLYRAALIIMIPLSIMFILLGLYGGALGTGFASIIIGLQLKNKKKENTESK